jgi:Caudovirus prohead serine protease
MRKPDGKQFRAFQSRINTVDDTNRTIEFAASTETPDRYGDVIRVDGWQLDNFQKNPVFLWAHRSEDPPIGRIISATKDMSGTPTLVETVQFASPDVYPFADTVYKLYKAGFMNAVSVGFLPLQYEPLMTRPEDEESAPFQSGWDYTTVEQLELSAVPVPANPEALGRVLKSVRRSSGEFDMRKLGHAILVEAKSLGVIDGEAIEKAERFFSFGESNPPWAYNIVGVTVAPPEKEGARAEANKVQRDDAGEDMESLCSRVKDLEENFQGLRSDHKALNAGHNNTKKRVKDVEDDVEGLKSFVNYESDDETESASRGEIKTLDELFKTLVTP